LIKQKKTNKQKRRKGIRKVRQIFYVFTLT
jgi:hypothetical protein